MALDGTTFQSVEDCRLQVAHGLEKGGQLLTTGKKRLGVPHKHLQGLNAKVTPVQVHAEPGGSGVQW